MSKSSICCTTQRDVPMMLKLRSFNYISAIIKNYPCHALPQNTKKSNFLQVCKILSFVTWWISKELSEMLKQLEMLTYLLLNMILLNSFQLYMMKWLCWNDQLHNVILTVSKVSHHEPPLKSQTRPNNFFSVNYYSPDPDPQLY